MALQNNSKNAEIAQSHRELFNNSYFKRALLFCSKLYSNQFKFIYILKCWNTSKNPFYYVGQTSNIFRRIRHHYISKSITTESHKYKHKKLVYLEFHDKAFDIFKREKEVIDLPLNEKLCLINTFKDKEFLEQIDNSIRNRERPFGNHHILRIKVKLEGKTKKMFEAIKLKYGLKSDHETLRLIIKTTCDRVTKEINENKVKEV